MVSPVLWFVFFVVLFAVVFYLYWQYEKKRQQQFGQQAQRLGLQYERDSSEQLPQRFAQFSVFGQGFSRRARHVLRGTYRGVPVRLFEFQYKTQTHNGKHQQTQTHLVGVGLAILDQVLATTRIVPESVGHKLWDALGGDDIDFESDEFSRRFWVKSSDRRAAYDLIHPRMMEFLLRDGWKRWEVTAPGVCVWQQGRLSPQRCQEVLDRLVEFVILMPQHSRRAEPVMEARR